MSLTFSTFRSCHSHSTPTPPRPPEGSSPSRKLLPPTRNLRPSVPVSYTRGKDRGSSRRVGTHEYGTFTHRDSNLSTGGVTRRTPALVLVLRLRSPLPSGAPRLLQTLDRNLKTGATLNPSSPSTLSPKGSRTPGPSGTDRRANVSLTGVDYQD